MKLHCVKCGHLLPKDEGAKSLLPFEVYRCRNCGDGLLFDMDTKQAFLVPKTLGLFGMTLAKIRKATKKIPYVEEY